jgi:signal transduction histidine kinase
MLPRSSLQILATVAAFSAGPVAAADSGALMSTGALILGPGLLIALVILALVLRTRLARGRREVRELTVAVERLTRGELGIDISSADTADIGVLAHSLDRLRLSLRTTAMSRDYLSQVISSISDAQPVSIVAR